MNPAAQKLKKISTLDSLITFLRDEMGWPIETDNFEDVVFEYSAEELGIDEASAAKIDSIRRLQPLTVGQPWGVFFVEFEPRKLPVTALRRILNEVVTKKRATKADQTTWDMEDLMFISSVGEGTDRAINFAHFSRGESGRLPSLKVIAWDSDDTPLHMEDVADKLTEKLAWPADGEDTDTWQQAWSSAFTLHHKEVITTSKMLATSLAELARNIRDQILRTLEIETEDGPMRNLLRSFKDVLLHDLDAADFADMYAQTIAYGLLSARVLNPKSEAVNSAVRLPITNPFLKELLEAFLAFSDGLETLIPFDELGVNEVTDLLNEANMAAVVADFGNKKPDEDPVVHFYEDFLADYDPQVRAQRGVFFTPQPIVTFIVNQVDESLMKTFGLEDGLADTATWEQVSRSFSFPLPAGVSPEDPFVRILDPATGTGTFLVFVIDKIHRTLVTRWRQEGMSSEEMAAAWNRYVPENLLPRLNGYEILMAPYAIAHLKVGLKLLETGYDFSGSPRVNIFLTNSLEPPIDMGGQFEWAVPAVAHEASLANAVKRDARFTAIIGNPPYSNFGTTNQNDFISHLLNEYKRDLNEQKLNLDDDFIKFVRLGQHLVDQAGCGVLGLVTNNTFLNGITHRRMRESLMNTFSSISILDLHGSSAKRERAPDGSNDENVFDIQQGVSISVFARPPTSTETAVLHRDLWGTRSQKCAQLEGSQLPEATILHPKAPQFFFIPVDLQLENEYGRFASLREIFKVAGPGVKTERDRVSIHFQPADVAATIDLFKKGDASKIREKFALGADSRDWSVGRAVADVAKNDSKDRIVPVLYRPFDVRYTWYSGQSRGFIGTPGAKVMSHMLGPEGIGLVGMRQYEYAVPEYSYVFVATGLVECRVFVSNRGIAHVFPLYDAASDRNSQSSFGSESETNLTDEFCETLASSMALGMSADGLPTGVSALAILGWIYAVLHSTEYRVRYAPLLKIDYPRIPYPASLDQFNRISKVGLGLIEAHINWDKMPPTPNKGAPFGADRLKIEKVTYDDGTVWVDRRKTMGFLNVPQAVWEYNIGGYQVCYKWLANRKGSGGRTPIPGRDLGPEDLAKFSQIVGAIDTTIRRRSEIDRQIETLGGFPHAFHGSGPASSG